MGGGVVCTPSDVSEAAPRQLRAEGLRRLPVPLRALPHQPVQGEGRGRGRSLYPISQYKVRGVGGGVVCTPADVSEAAPRQLRAEGLRLLPVPLRALPHQPVQGEGRGRGRSLYPISQYKVRGVGGGVVCTPSDVSEAAPRQLRAEGLRLLPVPLRALPHQPVQGEGRGRGA